METEYHWFSKTLMQTLWGILQWCPLQYILNHQFHIRAVWSVCFTKYFYMRSEGFFMADHCCCQGFYELFMIASDWKSNQNLVVSQLLIKKIFFHSIDFIENHIQLRLGKLATMLWNVMKLPVTMFLHLAASFLYWINTRQLTFFLMVIASCDIVCSFNDITFLFYLIHFRHDI